jgi:hypothetical protein
MCCQLSTDCRKRRAVQIAYFQVNGFSFTADFLLDEKTKRLFQVTIRPVHAEEEKRIPLCRVDMVGLLAELQRDTPRAGGESRAVDAVELPQEGSASIIQSHPESMPLTGRHQPLTVSSKVHCLMPFVQFRTTIAGAAEPALASSGTRNRRPSPVTSKRCSGAKTCVANSG